MSYLPLLVLALAVAWRMRRLDRARPLRPRLMLTGAVVYAVLVAGLLWLIAPSPLGWLCLAAGLVLGALAGWQRARLMRLHVEPGGRVMVRQSPAALLLLVALAVGRRLLLPHHPNIMNEEGEVPASLLNLTDGLFGFALGMIAAQAIELWRRGRALQTPLK